VRHCSRSCQHPGRRSTDEVPPDDIIPDPGHGPDLGLLHGPAGQRGREVAGQRERGGRLVEDATGTGHLTVVVTEPLGSLGPSVPEEREGGGEASGELSGVQVPALEDAFLALTAE